LTRNPIREKENITLSSKRQGIHRNIDRINNQNKIIKARPSKKSATTKKNQRHTSKNALSSATFPDHPNDRQRFIESTTKQPTSSPTIQKVGTHKKPKNNRPKLFLGQDQTKFDTPTNRETSSNKPQKRSTTTSPCFLV
jgi:hypothetical protein